MVPRVPSNSLRRKRLLVLGVVLSWGNVTARRATSEPMCHLHAKYEKAFSRLWTNQKGCPAVKTPPRGFLLHRLPPGWTPLYSVQTAPLNTAGLVESENLTAFVSSQTQTF